MTAQDAPQAPKLYATAEPIFPKKISGKFRHLKWIIMAITLGIYYITPWIRWDRGPNLPDQAVLIDLAHRRFYFFWIEIWSHEFYFVAGLLIMAGLGLFLFTSALGRVWCGYACPQTVWTDLFFAVERWIEGDRNARIRLYRDKWNLHKWRLRLTKWTAWLLIGAATGGAWVFYFADAPTLFVDLFTGQAAFMAYGWVGALTLTTFVLGGFTREQVCIYMCPWPRIQAAMMDPDTLTVAYRDWRGEPRMRGKKRKTQAEVGDCIDCNACVSVCPVGIDIRDGQQLECITCALCIDACDEMMDKIGAPRGLIDYCTLNDEPRERAGEKPIPAWRHIVRVRTVLYFTLWALIGIGMIVALFIRSDIEMTVSPIRNPIFITMSDGTIRNAYELRLRNKAAEHRDYRVYVVGEEPFGVTVAGQEGLIVEVPANETRIQRVFVEAPGDSRAAAGHLTNLYLWIEDVDSGRSYDVKTVFNGRDDDGRHGP
ncbi:MAG: cytochrome c oxidase accessory protein CcoG [Pseudomonadota bacterium]